MHQSHPDIQTRKVIWLALAELYLDTELLEEDFKRIASIFKQTRYGLNFIKEIDLYEVFPLLQYNLLNLAGEWAAFNSEWLFAGCERFYGKRNNIFYRLRIKFWNSAFYWMRRDYWKAIEKEYTATDAAS